MADSLTLDDLKGWLGSFRSAVAEQAEHLTALDAAIGDADHGSNLTRGTAAVTAAVEADDAPSEVGPLFAKVGMTLVTSVGGASGPLYGTFFMRFGAAAGAVTELDGEALLAAFRAGVEGVLARGKAEAGDKTMYDALAPALAALESGLQGGASLHDALCSAARAAEEGRDATEPLVARKGRASYLGERSAGHVDPGAASSALLVAALADAAA